MRPLVLGAVLIFAGVSMFFVGLTSKDDTQVDCGSDVIHPGDICRTTVNGEETDRTYAEQKAENKSSNVEMMYFSPFSVLGGLAVITATIVTRRRSRLQPPAPPMYGGAPVPPPGGYTPAPHAGPPPAGGHPPQPPVR